MDMLWKSFCELMSGVDDARISTASSVSSTSFQLVAFFSSFDLVTSRSMFDVSAAVSTRSSAGRRPMWPQGFSLNSHCGLEQVLWYSDEPKVMSASPALILSSSDGQSSQASVSQSKSSGQRRSTFSRSTSTPPSHSGRVVLRILTICSTLGLETHSISRSAMEMSAKVSSYSHHISMAPRHLARRVKSPAAPMNESSHAGSTQKSWVSPWGSQVIGSSLPKYGVCG
mmetsp:Transcript_31240/g.99269  ORF Transcript_31240/g.99269 Transcript_31240/m.99269 type:complete len:227 (+) Transcript_31240:106-786(+)